MSREISIYIHIPFCKSKCNYCDFNSFSGIDYLADDYFKALKLEAGKYVDELRDYHIGTIFFGGGTPSYVNHRYISGFLSFLREAFSIGPDAEISLEANPGTLTFENLKKYVDCGINRLSIGVQACQNELLKTLGRIHTIEEFKENIGLAFRAGFTNINADLIFGIPGQNRSHWLESLRQVVDTGVKHISCYSLTIEEGTPFWEMVNEKKLVPVEDELDRKMYHDALKFLSGRGFEHYEISNFAMPGYRCRHNLVYWKCNEYIGLGAGAHSYYKNCRYANERDPKRYINLLKSEKDHVTERHDIDRQEAMSEFMIMGLRLIEGVSEESFRERFGTDLYDVFGDAIERLTGRNLIEKKGNFIRLTEKGLDLANQAFIEFI